LDFLSFAVISDKKPPLRGGLEAILIAVKASLVISRVGFCRGRVLEELFPVLVAY
jgi:hypothetical protein